MNSEKILQFYKEKLYKEFNLTPVFGCELEFYITEKNLSSLSAADSTPQDWQSKISRHNINVTKERGFNQFETQLNPTSNIYKLLEEIKRIKEKISEILNQHDARALFTAKPFNDQPGSALHIHSNFVSGNIKSEHQTNNELNFIIGGLLYTLSDLMIFFAPNADSYKRYTNKSMNTPANVSWGYNNRTTALRLLKNSEGIPRIEHRIAGSDAEPLDILAAILCGTYLGLEKKIVPTHPIYGLAFDSQYKRMAFPTNLIDAKNSFTNSQLWDMFNSFT